MVLWEDLIQRQGKVELEVVIILIIDYWSFWFVVSGRDSYREKTLTETIKKATTEVETQAMGAELD